MRTSGFPLALGSEAVGVAYTRVIEGCMPVPRTLAGKASHRDRLRREGGGFSPPLYLREANLGVRESVNEKRLLAEALS